MYFKFLFILLAITVDLGSNVPVHFKDFLLNPSCTFWERSHDDKFFFYLIGTAAYIEANAVRLKEYFEKTLFKGTEASIQSDEDDVEGDGEPLTQGDSDDLDALVRNMVILRRTLDEYYLPHLSRIITNENRMLSFNTNPFLNEFSLLKIKVHDLDCLLQYWIKQRRPELMVEEGAIKEVPEYDLRYTNSKEMKLLQQLSERLDWFLRSKALVTLVRSLLLEMVPGIEQTPEQTPEPVEEEPDEQEVAEREIRYLHNLFDGY